MKYFVLLATILLLPYGVWAAPLTQGECAMLAEVPFFAQASITVNTQTNGYDGCSILFDSGEQGVIGAGLSIVSVEDDPGALPGLIELAKSSANDFEGLFCGTTTTCNVQENPLEDGYVHVTDWETPAKAQQGRNVYVAQGYRGYAIAFNGSETSPDAFDLRLSYEAVLAQVHRIIDVRMGDGVQEEATATIVAVSGEVELIPQGDGRRAVPLKVGDVIRATDRIYTGLGGSARIAFADGHVAIIRELSEVTIDSARNSLLDRLFLAAGEVSILRDAKPQLKSDFQIKTPTATCSVRGTTFSVSYDDQANVTQLKVSEGAVSIESNAEGVLIEGGQQATVGEDGEITTEVFDGVIETGKRIPYLLWVGVALVLFIGGYVLHKRRV